MARLKDRISQFRNFANSKGIIGGFNKLNNQIDEQISTRPTYNINPEVYANKDLATNRAFGRDQSIQGQENNIEQNAVDDFGMAKNYSNSASALLSTLSSINDNKNQTLRGLATDEAGIQRQNMGDLYNANNALSEEKDKAFDYNVNAPWQNKLAMLRDKKKSRQENFWKILDTVTSIGGMALGGRGGGGQSNPTPNSSIYNPFDYQQKGNYA